MDLDMIHSTLIFVLKQDVNVKVLMLNVNHAKAKEEYGNQSINRSRST